MPSRRLSIILAFLAIYVVWGSTYLAIRFAIETLPGFLMAGVRFVCAGGLLYLYSKAKGAGPATWAQWRAAAIVGSLMLFVGNGSVVFAQHRTTSGLAALLVALTPLWMVLYESFRQRKVPPRMVVFGVLLGFCGLGVLVGPKTLGGQDRRIEPVAALALVQATIAWAAGSLYGRVAPLPKMGSMATAMQMLCGGGLLLIAGLVSGEASHVNLMSVSLRSVLSVVYLVIFGSLIGYSAYMWLVKEVSPVLVSTYAFVNPLVAVFLGWLFASETLGLRVLLSSLIIILGVACITLGRK